MVKLALLTSLACVVAMVAFNYLASKTANAATEEAYRAYATYAFESLKILFGAVMGTIVAAHQHNKRIKAYQQTIKAMKTEQFKTKDSQ